MDRSRERRNTRLLSLALALVTLAGFWPVLRNDFILYDDEEYLTENPAASKGLSWAGVKWAFTTGYASNWHPLTWLSHQLDSQLYGLHPFGHHLSSLLLHLASTMLLFLLLKRLTGAVWPSVFVAALFGLHPMHVESVAWAAERKDVVSAFFFMLTLWAYARYAESGSQRAEVGGQRSEGRDQRAEVGGQRAEVGQGATIWYGAALLLFALGLMSKPMLVTLPFVLLLVDYWPLQRLQSNRRESGGAGLWRVLLEKVPFVVLAVASSVATYMVQSRSGAVNSLEAVPLDFRISNALVSYVRYIGKMFWPARLSIFYPLPDGWPANKEVAAGLLLAGVTVWVVMQRKRRPYLAVGWFWYLGMLVPVIGLVTVGQHAMADRYSYLPLIGLFLMIAWLGWDLAERRPATRAWLGSLGMAALGVCAMLTWRQVGYWRNNVTVFAHALDVTSENALAHSNLGVSLFKAKDLGGAERHFAEAIRLKPYYAEALFNLGWCRQEQGRFDEATELFRRAVEARDSGRFEYALAAILARQKKYSEAEPRYRAALRLRPDLAEVWYSLGEMQAEQGKEEEAMKCYAAALKAKPDYSAAHVKLGGLLANLQRMPEAIPHLRAAAAAFPQNPDAHYNLAGALDSTGDYAGAASEYAETCRLRPGDREARSSFGVALMNAGKLAEAAAQFEELLRGQPDPQANYYLGRVQEKQGQAAEAVSHYREALRLDPKVAAYPNSLAWILATHPRDDIRNGAEAVRLAEQACGLTGGKQPQFLATLDAAYAEAGRFPEAIAAATRTRDLALAAGQKEIAKAAEKRLALYAEQKPVRIR